MRIGDATGADGIGGAGGAMPLRGSGRAEGAGAGGASFSEVLEGVLGEVSGLQAKADRAVEGLVTGEVRDAHSVVLAFEKAQLAFQLTMEVRNKLVESYQEIMRMQL